MTEHAYAIIGKLFLMTVLAGMVMACVIALLIALMLWLSTEPEFDEKVKDCL